MKLSVGKTTIAWIKVGFSVGAYTGFGYLIEVQIYIAVVLLGIAFILLGYALPDFQYLREKQTRLVGSYTIFILMSLLHASALLAALSNKTVSSTILRFTFFTFFAVLALSILVYFLISKKVKPVLSTKSKPLDIGIDNNFTTKPYRDFSNNSPIDSLKKLATPLNVTFSLFLFANILVLVSLFLGEYVSFGFAIAIIVMAAILPLSKYLRGEPGRLSFAYIALLNGSYLIILPAAAIGFTFHGVPENWIPLLAYIPPALLAVSFLIYFSNRVNINPILKGILRKMYCEKESRINTFNQLSKTEARKYKGRLYLTIFASLTILNAIAITIDKLIPSDGGGVFIVSSIAFLALAVFTLKRFLPIAKLYPFSLYHFLLLIAASEFYKEPDEPELKYLGVFYFTPVYLLFIGLAFVAYEIYRNITKSKFAWGDVAVGTKEAVVDIENEDNKIRSKLVK